jgi:uncharacterized protein Yka (UPF0111/DUF47 family)
MTEKTKNVFEKLQETLELVAEEIHMANDALYVVATETMDLSEQVTKLNAKMDGLLSAIPSLIPEKAEIPVIKEPVFPKIELPSTEKKVK